MQDQAETRISVPLAPNILPFRSHEPFVYKERKRVSFYDRDMFEGDGGMVVENTRDARAAVDSVPL